MVLTRFKRKNMKVGFVGWRGMVGSVLMQRMREENDFTAIEPVFFTTSAVGGEGPVIGKAIERLKDAYAVDSLSQMDVIVSCQGGDYTKAMFKPLRGNGWRGYWIDAASVLRMEKDSVIVLDPLNGHLIEQALNRGIKNFIGGNCTVSLMLMAIGALIPDCSITTRPSIGCRADAGVTPGSVATLLISSQTSRGVTPLRHSLSGFSMT